MIRISELANDNEFPSRSLMRMAHAIADVSGDRAGPTIASLFERECSTILGAGDRREMLEAFFAERAARQHLLLEGLGLSRTSTEPCVYGLGTWSLAAELVGKHYIFVLSGIRDPSGAVVSARMSARSYYGAALVWRAIADAADLDPRTKPSASAWRRLWNGFDYRTSCGERHRESGLRCLLHRDLLDREKGLRS